MLVTSLRLYRLSLPLVHEFETSSHRKNHIEHIVIEASDESGAVGWGEIATGNDPYFAAESTDTAWLIAQRYLAPALLGASWDHPSEAGELWGRVRGNRFAKSGFDMAAWVLWAERQRTPLAAALGGTRSTVEAGVSLGIEKSIDELLTQVQLHIDSGYGRVKLKVAPGWEFEPVRAVRDAFPGVSVHVDANAVYGPGDIDHVARFDELGLAMIEQPFGVRDFLSHARLQARISTPVCLDESIESLDDLAVMLRLDAGRVLNVKTSRLGGLTAARAAHDLAQENGVPVWCGGMHEFGIGRLANVAISSLPGFALPSDVSASSKYYARDIVIPPVTAVGGRVQVPDGIGLGAQVDVEYLAALASETALFEA